jgi:L-lactate dehydrogenase complex protein LldE
MPKLLRVTAISENSFALGAAAGRAPKVALFVTCLVDLFRPSVGFATVKLLEQAGCEVSVPELQTCCGQPAYNSGDSATTRSIAKQVIAAFEDYDYVVAPSGSCIGMLREHYPRVFPTDAQWRGRAEDLAGRCFELLEFLHDEMEMTEVYGRYAAKVTYHDSCSGLRELGVKDQPRALLESVDDLELEEMTDANVCCGFGGTFCVKYPEISSRLVQDKIGNVTASGADTVLGGDLGCLLNIAGKLKREGSAVKVYHVAEVLAGTADETAPIGER